MIGEILIGKNVYEALFGRGADLSIPLDFSKNQPGAFHLPKAAKTDSIKPVSRGGSCNCFTITMTPHGNGTHTEGAGHISRNASPVPNLCKEPLIPATLVTVKPVSRNKDRIIPADLLAGILKKSNRDFLEAIIVRTLPNGEWKKRRNYSGTNPPYFAKDAVLFLNRMGITHLLTDLPSLDREDDPNLTAHRAFLGAKKGKTITEMIYANRKIPDGFYLLSLQFPNMILDAVPSRPILYPVRAKKGSEAGCWA